MIKRRKNVVKIDLSRMRYDAWLAFVFDHEPPPDGNLSDAWYWQSELELETDPEVQIEHLTRLFESSQLVAGRYSAEQIEVGFWFMFGGGAHEKFADPLWNTAISWEARARCIRAIPRLYDDLFSSEFDADGVAWMLWDFLTFDYDCGNRQPAVASEDRRVQNEMLEALRHQLMRGRSEMAQRAALHGIFHLSHPAGQGLIRTYLESRHPSPQLRLYAEQVVKGEAI